MLSVNAAEEMSNLTKIKYQGYKLLAHRNYLT